MASKRMHSSSPQVSRRTFIVGAAAVAASAGLAGALPESLANAATRSPQKFDLSQVKHLVFLMQENRSFDHYFGTFPGARGFSDPTAIRLPNGNSVFQQPDPSNPDGYLEPWHMSTITAGGAAIPSLNHNWQEQHMSWNNGAMDGWMPTQINAGGPAIAPFTMGYYKEEDLPFHWALAKSFTLLDHYHCSVLSASWPNRLYWEVGSNDPQGKNGGPNLNTGGTWHLTYETAAETCYKAGISYKYYQTNSNSASYGSEQLFFVNFQQPGLVPPAVYNSVAAFGTLFGDGTPGGIGDPANPTLASYPSLGFEEDCANGVLPDVSFIGQGPDVPSPYTEHAPSLPALGAGWIASKLQALAANDELWNTTVFVLNYDEGDGFFDHVVPPTPNPNKDPDEFVTVASPAAIPGLGLPVGAGMRVPAMIISPWSVGGHIFSGLSDHTSCLQLIEAVAAAGGLSGKGPVTFPNISRWRRATFGDLTGTLHPGAPQSFPANTQFDPATLAAYLAAQTKASLQPLPARPGATQDFPYLHTVHPS